jgi:recombination protein RecA
MMPIVKPFGADSSEDLTKLVNDIKNDMKRSDSLRVLKDVELFIPTGAPQLDIAMGGGVPCGRLITKIGRKSAGKSSFLLKVIAQCQKMGGLGVLLDIERSAWLARSVAMGVDIDRLIFAQPDSLDTYTLELPDGAREKRLGAFDMAEAVTWSVRKHNAKVPVVIGFDSIAGASTAVEMEGDVGDATMGKHARLVSQGLRKLMPYVYDFNIALIFVNQLKEKIGVMYGSPDTYIAKNPIDFHSSITMQLTQAEFHPDPKNKDTAEGIVTRVNITKNKLADPFREVLVRVFYDRGIDPLWETIECLKDYGRLGEKPGYVIFEEKSRRKSELYGMAVKNPKIREILFQEVDELICEKTGKKGKSYAETDATAGTAVHAARTPIPATPEA